MKKVLSLILALTMLLASVGVFAADGDITVNVNGDKIETAVISKDGAVFVPLSKVFEALGLDIAIDGETAIVKGGAVDTSITVGSSEIKQGNMTVSAEFAPFKEGEEIYVSPDVIKTIGAYSVSLNEETNELNIVYNKFNGKFVKIIHKSTGRAFSILNGSFGDGARVYTEEESDSTMQVWKLTSRGEGIYACTNVKTERSFDIPNGRSDLNLELIQYGITNSTNQWVKIVENPDGTYYLKCVHAEDLFLTVDENNLVAQNEFTGDESQTYIIKEVTVTPPSVPEVEGAEVPEEYDAKDGKFFSIINKESGLALSVEGASIEEGASVTAEEASSKDSQAWKFTVRGKNLYEIANKMSFLSISLPDGKADVGNKVVQKRATFDGGMVFELVEKEDGAYLIRHKKTGLYLTVSGGEVIFNELLTDRSQLFELKAPMCDESNHERDPLGGKYYAITHNGLTVSVENDSVNNGAAIVTAENTGDDAQLWAFVAQGNGKYVIANKLSGRVFDIPAASRVRGAGLTQYDANYGWNQIFEPIEQENGKYLIRNLNSSLYLTVRDGRLTQDSLFTDKSDMQLFTLTESGESEMKMIGAAATLFLIKGDSSVSNAKLQWNAVTGADTYDIYRSVDGGDYEFFTSLTGTTIDDYDLELGKSYSYAVYALNEGRLIDYVKTEAVTPYALPSDLKSSSNLEESGLARPNSLCVDGVYYRFYERGGGKEWQLMMTTSTDDITYSEPVEVLNASEILAHETCQNFQSARFESQNFVYNPIKNKFAFIAHFEADGGYGTARTSIATATPGERFTFHGAYRPDGGDTRDLNVYVDDDYSAYVIAAINMNADLALYKLNEDWSGFERFVCFVNRNSHRELPSMLKVDGRYYLFTSGTAGWYPTQGMYNTATSIEGPWSELRIVGNTTTFSSQSGTVSRLKEGSENYIMSTYRWMYFWQDSIVRRTTNRRYPIKVSNGYAFYDFFDEILYNWDNDILIPVQNGRILSQGKPSVTPTVTEKANLVNDGNYRTVWAGKTQWPYTWEVDLGEIHSLREMQISWLIWNGSEPYYRYKVEASVDGKTYTTILDRTEGFTDYGFTIDQLSSSARYVRLTVTDAKPRSSNENFYPSQLYEVKILGE